MKNQNNYQPNITLRSTEYHKMKITHMLSLVFALNGCGAVTFEDPAMASVYSLRGVVRATDMVMVAGKPKNLCLVMFSTLVKML